MQYIVNAIAIVIVVVIVFWAIQFQNSPVHGDFMYTLHQAFQNVGKFVDTKKHNIALETAPTRKAPVTFIAKETKLRNYLPKVFGDFNSSDWNRFWSLMYTPVEEKGGFGVKRYRTKDEIESYLQNRYNSFSFFKDSHWESFWNIIDINWSVEEQPR